MFLGHKAKTALADPNRISILNRGAGALMVGAGFLSLAVNAVGTPVKRYARSSNIVTGRSHWMSTTQPVSLQTECSVPGALTM